MELGVSTASYFSRMYTEEAISRISKLGASVCEVFFATRSEYTSKFADMLNAELRKANDIAPLKVHSIHALTNQFEPELFTVNSRAYADAIETLESVLATGEKIGAKYYTFHGATILKRAVKYSFNFEHISERINNACQMSEQHGIKLCYENVHWAYYSTPDYFAELKKHCSQLGAVLDIKQAMQSGIDYTKFLEVSGDRLQTVHLCDYDNDGNLAIPGRGSFDFVQLFKRLMDIGFDGACLMEVYTKNYNTEDELQESFDFLTDCMARANN